MSTNPQTGRHRQIVEARALFERVLNGDLRARADVMETMTTSDFPYLLGAAYGRELLQEYSGIAPVWPGFARRSTVADFKEKTLVELLGGRAGLNKVKEGAEYKARSVKENKYSFKVEKYGDRIPLTWEMLVNDELDAFRDLPTRLATAARETEDITAASVLFNAAGSGLNTTFFAAGNGNAPGTAKLSEAALEAALLNISTRKDTDGRPIVISGGVLMVPPALEMTGRRILNAREIRRTVDGVTSIEDNYLSGTVRLLVNPWLSVVHTGANAATTWFVLPDPSSTRPAVVAAFLRGHEAPDLRVKADAGNRVGGGPVAPEEGSFDDDTIQYRVRHVNGAGTVIPTGTYASTGSA
ncbi:Mu-like prophage major head subunit gpT family protein [Occultella kanbiaonis]|uniref:phage major capsid protein n=1 Tax=Occultella kanbiaonis TaxID=2675754 RepID=UPI0013D0A7EB|nr:Mu-like prophage major head subunit gpT family protein [Occultella kanbiaonis]